MGVGLSARYLKEAAKLERPRNCACVYLVRSGWLWVCVGRFAHVDEGGEAERVGGCESLERVFWGEGVCWRRLGAL